MVMLLRRGLISAAFLLTLVLLFLLQLGIISTTVGCCSCCSFCGDEQQKQQQQQHGVGDLRPGRRLLIGHHQHQVVLAKGSMELKHAEEGGDVLDEEKREVLTGPNPLHNR
ncbi:Os03g0366100 [Oryza sativa Japonica Group]|uniref:CLE family OsCLE303 protein n=3 Tax=Oryza TaxID=4527 RepID=Q10KY4_ORYSJ|nr:expressed protein [Oryza sativa Japonica Group]KAB8091902.1 hypothetical protein EE612_017591 [Oryza sativa]EAZ27030.1 hypothetical protein OsJ_10959 [Oryza sativa Japonica Group]KAF2939381.1 hypothetical protein DAI22_03g189000 [Oryza sativa Japonica Group]BAF12092.1 Os03g0366100 [Oryza sativa Japonica Group]|eukprot:NP_001050178.1 Os03g0366100 [Oryza sativa Japonica Group]